MIISNIFLDEKPAHDCLYLQRSCQMAYFQTKNIELNKFWRVLYIMEDVGILYGHLVYFAAPWFILWLFGNFFTFWYIVNKNKSGNPALQ
jgi:hypothetical protein